MSKSTISLFVNGLIMLAMPVKIKNAILALADTMQMVNAPMTKKEKNVLKFLKKCCA